MKRADRVNLAVALAIGVCVATLAYFRREAPASAPQIFDIDFGVWRPTPTRQVGPAATGNQGDYWNVVGKAWDNDHVERQLKFASGQAAPISVELVNLGGGWSSGGEMGVKAPMLDSFNYPQNNQGGNSHVILRDIPVGNYDLYLYGHGTDPKYFGDYTVSVGDRSYGRKQTSSGADAIDNKAWVEGSQYVAFAGLKVDRGEALNILIQPGQGAIRDTMICGLQLVNNTASKSP